MELDKATLYNSLLCEYELGGDELFFEDPLSLVLQEIRQQTSEPERAAPVVPKTTPTKNLSESLQDLKTKRIYSAAQQRWENPLSAKSLNDLHRMICESPLYSQGQRHQSVLNGQGNQNNPPLMLIGYSPSPEDMRLKMAFSGDQGALLKNMMAKVIGIDKNLTYSNFFHKSLLAGYLRSPERQFLIKCLQKEIELVKPQVILCFGRQLANVLFQVDGPEIELQSQEFKLNDVPAFVTFPPQILVEQTALRAKTLPVLTNIKKIIS